MQHFLFPVFKLHIRWIIPYAFSDLLFFTQHRHWRAIRVHVHSSSSFILLPYSTSLEEQPTT